MSKQFRVRDLRNGDWYWIHKQVLEIISDKVGAKGVTVYNWLCYFAGNKTESCFPSLSTLATKCHFSTRTLIRILRDMKALGIISIEHNRGQVNTYHLLKCVEFVTSDTTALGGSDTTAIGVVTREHHEQEIINKNKKTPSFFSLRSRYFNQNLIDQVFKAIASTRKTNQVSESVLIAQLQKWKKYPIEQVEAGIRVYLEKDCAAQGKREQYLLGIIRNQKTGEPKQESTGSALLDSYYARNHR